MRKVLRKHKKKIIAGHMLIFSILAVSLLTTEKVASIFFDPYKDTVSIFVGEKAKIDIQIDTKVPVNAVGATVRFPQDKLEIVAISKELSLIDLWTEDTIIMEKEGKLQFSGGTLKKGGFTGTGTVLTITIKARKPGKAVLSFENAQILAHDGKGSNILGETRSLTYIIQEKNKIVEPKIFYGRDIRVSYSPSPDLNEDGKINLIDISILSGRLFGRYNSRYDLNGDNAVNLFDLSILFSKVFSWSKN